MQANSVLPSNSVRPDPLVLVAEVTHRVVNEYSQAIAGIRLAATSVASNEARAVLATAAARLLSFAEAHRAHQAPRPGESADLAAYLERLCRTISVSSLQERNVRLTLNAAPASLAAERCWRVGLIVSELITNGVRHGLRGGPGAILVELTPEGRDIACRVTDNGRGSQCAKPGCGFSVVSGLADELGGSMSWHFTPGGTTAELKFPHIIEEIRV